MLGAQSREEASDTRQSAALQLAVLACTALACYLVLNFLIPLSSGYLSYPSASLIGRLPFWEAIRGLSLPVPQDAGAVISAAVGVSVALVICYALALRVVSRAAANRALVAVVVGGAILCALTSLLAMPNSNTDVYLYMMYARIFNVHGANPFTVWPAAFPGDPYLQYVPSAWVYTTSLYGPLWTLLSVVTWPLAGGDVVHDLLALRMLLLAINIANAALIWRVLGRFRPNYRLLGLLFYAWNPVVVLQGMGHVEPLIVLFLLVSVALYQDGRRWSGVLSAGISAVTKFVTAPLLVVSLFAAARTKYLKPLMIVCAVLGAGTLFLLPGNLFTARRLVFLPIFLGVVLWACLGQIPRERESTAGKLDHLLVGWTAVMFAFSFLLAPTMYPWYLITLVGVACIMASPRLAALTVVLTGSGLVNWMLSDAATFYMDPSVWIFRVLWWVPTCGLFLWLYRAEIRHFPLHLSAVLSGAGLASSPGIRLFYAGIVRGKGAPRRAHARYIHYSQPNSSREATEVRSAEPLAERAHRESRL